MSLSERLSSIPVVGALLSVAIDILLFGGDIIIGVVGGLVSTVELWIPMLSYLGRSSDMIDWLPREQIEIAIGIVAVALVGYYGYRILRRIARSIISETNQ